MTIAMAPLRALVVAMLGAAIAWSWFEGGALVPLIIAAVLTVVAIGSQVWGDAQLLSAVTAALTTFVTATLAVGDDADERTGDLVKAKFFAHYERDKKQPRKPDVFYLVKESAAERLVYSDSYGDIAGWGWSARGKRATELAKRLNTSDVAVRGLGQGGGEAQDADQSRRLAPPGSSP